MKTSSAKQKGRKLQQHVRDTILVAFPVLAEGDVRSTSMGAQGEDVQLSPRARECIPVAIETKARRGVAVSRWYEQAQEHVTEACKGSKASLNAVVVYKEDRKSPLAVVDFDYLVTLWQDAYNYKQAWLKQEREVSEKARKNVG